MPESGLVHAFFCRESVDAAITHYLLSQMLHLRAFLSRICDYAFFGVKFLAVIWLKFSEILRILAEILRKNWPLERNLHYPANRTQDLLQSGEMLIASVELKKTCGHSPLYPSKVGFPWLSTKGREPTPSSYP